MRRGITSIAITALLVLATLSIRAPTQAQPQPLGGQQPSRQMSYNSTNLLTNGDMDQLPFYPRPTNHYVAGQWFEWWGNYLTIPEYIDGGIPAHNVCYPMPADGRCHHEDPSLPNNSSQGYIRWGAPFIAGIYQPVHNTTPCTLYTFEIFNRNDAGNYHAKVGIDKSGWIITRLGNSPPDNCPPDGKSRCPDPYVASFPSTMVWSAESHQPAYTWAPISVTAEALGSSISVWTYAAPDYAGSQSTYWDYGHVVQTPFPDNRLPAPSSWHPSGFITNVTHTLSGTNLIIEWQTLAPASTQVWYTIWETGTPISNTGTYSYTVYFPLVSAFRPPTAYMTTLDTTPTISHQAVITDVHTGQRIFFAALSRRPSGEACVTEVSQVYDLTIGSAQMAFLGPSKAEELFSGAIVQR